MSTKNKNVSTSANEKVTALFEEHIKSKLIPALEESRKDVFKLIDKHLVENLAPAIIAYMQNNGKVLNESENAKINKSFAKFLLESEEAEKSESDKLKDELTEKENELEDLKLEESKLLKTAKSLNEAEEEAEKDEDKELSEEVKEEIKEEIKLQESENTLALRKVKRKKALLESAIEEIVSELQDLGAMAADESQLTEEEEKALGIHEVTLDEEEGDKTKEEEEDEFEKDKLVESAKRKSKKGNALLESIRASIEDAKRANSKKK